ncbi:MAG: GHMP kinase [Ignavibacteria bacterium]|nr:GHMP kinase [Ignavibacteria bacterium]
MIARNIDAFAPMRIADAGGWTDTWFAKHGAVLNIAVSPGVHVALRARARHANDPPVVLHPGAREDAYRYEPRGGLSGGHPLLEAAIDFMGIPEGVRADIRIEAEIPPGASTGTSASVTVALLAALARLHGRAFTPDGLARSAHHVEMDLLGWQCGVQDQIAAAHGGISFITISAFPDARVERLAVRAEVLHDLEQRLLLVYLGTSHRSSEVHRMVIADLEGEGPDSPRLDALRRCARDARDALFEGDLSRFGRALTENTDAQERLHPGLVGQAARRLIGIASTCGAAGWKVNGAGGEGGSVTLLCGDGPGHAQRVIEAIEAEEGPHRVIPVRLSPEGVRVSETTAES